MDFYHVFILSCFKKDKPMRTSTLYHLLKGKRTSSILTYGYFYKVLPYFSLLPKLKENDYQAILADLIKDKLLEVNSDGSVILSELGMKEVGRHTLPITEELNQLSFYKWDIAFFERVVFTTQVLSEKAYVEKDYVPIENNLFKQRRLKVWLSQQSDSLIHDFYLEWDKLIEKLSPTGQAIILKQLVGHNQRGQTLQQLAEENQQSHLFVWIEFKNYWHRLIQSILLEKNTYPLFYSLLIEEKSFAKEDSSTQTAQLFKAGFDIEEIAKKRQLKVSTVTDHLIEDYILSPSEIKLFNQEAAVCLNEYLTKEPNYLKWVYKEALSYSPELSFYDFKFFQFKLFEEEKNK